MDPQDIRAELKKAGYTAAGIGRELEVTGGAVRQIIDGNARSRRIEKVISELTDIALYNLWPQWYDAPKGLPKNFDPTRVNAQLWAIIERNMEAELAKRIPGLEPPFTIRATHRANIYNQCIQRGAAAIETPAGTLRVMDAYFEQWELDYEQATGEKPTPEAMRKWALYPTDSECEPTPANAAVTHVHASGGSQAAGRDLNVGEDRRRRQGRK
jgi:lambda repressor-like predicted transcriptional regulator